MATHLGSLSRTASTATSPTYSSLANTTDTNSDEDSDDSGAAIDYDVRASTQPHLAATALLPYSVCMFFTPMHPSSAPDALLASACHHSIPACLNHLPFIHASPDVSFPCTHSSALHARNFQSLAGRRNTVAHFFADHEPPIRCLPVILLPPFGHPWFDAGPHNGRPTRFVSASPYHVLLSFARTSPSRHVLSEPHTPPHLLFGFSFCLILFAVACRRVPASAMCIPVPTYPTAPSPPSTHPLLPGTCEKR